MRLIRCDRSIFKSVLKPLIWGQLLNALLILLALLCFTLSYGKPQPGTSCASEWKQPVSYRMLAPFVYMIRSFIRGRVNRWCTEPTFEEIRIASWRTYANYSLLPSSDICSLAVERSISVNLEGYAYVASSCSSAPGARLQFLDRVLRWIDPRREVNLSEESAKAWNAATHGIQHDAIGLALTSPPLQGASLLVDSGMGYEITPHGQTNEFGHFTNWVHFPDRHKRIDHDETLTITLNVTTCQSLKVRPTRIEVNLISPRGVLIVSDVDDILRRAFCWNVRKMIQSSLVEKFHPQHGMPEVLALWHDKVQGLHFHYTSDLPEQFHEFYVKGLDQHYPKGTFSFRQMTMPNLLHPSPRYATLKRLIESFPSRSIVMIGDTTTGSMISSFVRLAKEHPAQISCLVLRNVSATEPANWIVPNIKQLYPFHEKVFIYSKSNDLTRLNGYLVRLGDNENAPGCAEFMPNPYPWDQHKERGAIGSPWRSLVNGILGLVECAWVTRPSDRCRFDQQSISSEA